MAIIKIPSGSYQVKLRGSDGRWITRTFEKEKSAKQFEAETKSKILGGTFVSSADNQTTVDQYFECWFEEVRSRGTVGWRTDQKNRYQRYVQPVIGDVKIRSLIPAHISKVLREAASRELSEQSLLHIYNLMHKMFGDAVELFRILNQSPVLKSLRPKVPMKETAYLSVEQVEKLLQWVDGKPYEIAVWLGFFVGLRVGEIMALRWENVDLDHGVIHIRASYSRKENVMRDYPKGKKWHTRTVPPELLAKLRSARLEAKGDFVAPSPNQPMLSYYGYYDALKRYCSEAGLPTIGTHGLRHSASGFYMAHGASRDDLRKLFAHSSPAVTDRYVHDKGERVDQLARIIRLFPQGSERPTEKPCSINVPRDSENGVEQKGATC